MSTPFDLSIRPLGDAAIVVQLGEGISPTVHTKVKNVMQAIEENPFIGFVEALPAYNNVTIYYDPVTVFFAYPEMKEQTAFEKASAFIHNIVEQLDDMETVASTIIDIPVVYGGEFGPDLEEVAAHTHLSEEEVIHIHSSNEYLVYMIGFAPGFPFLGGMDERIATPRKESPRLAIPAGSVGIAGKQTGVYPLVTPGGWQIIGRTPTKLFLPDRNPPSLLNSGDTIRFVPISEEQFHQWKEEEQ